MSTDPYINKLLDKSLPISAKSPLPGIVSAVLDARAEKRGLLLEPWPSRVLQKNEIHELILTRQSAAPGDTVDQISYLCFFEVTQSGVLWQGDSLLINDTVIGKLAGYDYSHMPNHMNIVITTNAQPKTGQEWGLNPGDRIQFIFSQAKSN